MPKPILNLADVEFRKVGYGTNVPGAEHAPERFSAQVGDIGPRIGAQKLGYNLTVVPPGKRAWPFHNHRVNEEMFVILEGEGEVRVGKETFPIKKGDVIATSSRRARDRASDRQHVTGRTEVSRDQHGCDAGNLRLSGFSRKFAVMTMQPGPTANRSSGASPLATARASTTLTAEKTSD